MVVGTMKRRRKRRNWKQIQRKIERGRGEDSGRLRQKERERETARQRGGFGLPGTHSSCRQQSVSGGPLIQSAAASAREAPG